MEDLNCASGRLTCLVCFPVWVLTILARNHHYISYPMKQSRPGKHQARNRWSMLRFECRHRWHLFYYAIDLIQHCKNVRPTRTGRTYTCWSKNVNTGAMLCFASHRLGKKAQRHCISWSMNSSVIKKTLSHLGERQMNRATFWNICCVGTKLPTTTLRAWEEHAPNNENPSYESLITFLQRRMRVLETLLVNKSETLNDETQSYARRNNFTRTSSFATTDRENNRYHLCSGIWGKCAIRGNSATKHFSLKTLVLWSIVYTVGSFPMTRYTEPNFIETNRYSPLFWTDLYWVSKLIRIL